METSGSRGSKDLVDLVKPEPIRGQARKEVRTDVRRPHPGLGPRVVEWLDGRRATTLAASFTVILFLAMLFLVYGSLGPSAGEGEPPSAEGSLSLLTGEREDASQYRGPAAGTEDHPDASTDPATDPLSRTTRRWVVQVGAFRDPSNAEQVAASLREKLPGFEISILQSNLHLVRVGPFRERTTADSTLWSVEDVTGLTPVVIRLDSDE